MIKLKDDRFLAICKDPRELMGTLKGLDFDKPMGACCMYLAKVYAEKGVSLIDALPFFVACTALVDVPIIENDEEFKKYIKDYTSRVVPLRAKFNKSPKEEAAFIEDNYGLLITLNRIILGKVPGVTSIKMVASFIDILEIFEDYVAGKTIDQLVSSMEEVTV